MALGWKPSSAMSGQFRRVWTRSSDDGRIFVPLFDLIPDAVCERILVEAE
jgi:hypothetical protein